MEATQTISTIAVDELNIGPQPGPQTAFLSTLADIAFYGGAAGGGKSYALLLEPLRHFNNPKFGGVIFRRSTVQVRNEGGLWDESMGLYMPLGSYPVESFLEWTFPKGSRLKFAHLEHENTVFDWQGSQIAFIGFDEVTHFTEKQFIYMLSRNRSTCGVPPYIRATCNPDVDSWVRKWVDWYIGEDGYPIRERSGVIRWFIRIGDELIWADSKEELEGLYPGCFPKSFTFIPSKLSDNRILMSKDPGYLANLKALSRVERMRLLEGNWNIRASAGNFFQAGWFEVIDAMPYDRIMKSIRYWDRAATKPNESNPDPDWTVGCLMHRLNDGTYVVEDVRRLRDTPLKVENFIKNTASFDTSGVPIGIEQDPGSSGVADAGNYLRLLAGFDVRVRKPHKDKETRAKPVSAQSEGGNIKLLRGPWNSAFLNELENFPSPESQGHDDQVDAFSGAFNELASEISILDVL